MVRWPEGRNIMEKWCGESKLLSSEQLENGGGNSTRGGKVKDQIRYPRLSPRSTQTH